MTNSEFCKHNQHESHYCCNCHKEQLEYQYNKGLIDAEKIVMERLDRKSWATGFSDGIKEALIIIENGTYKYDEERQRLVEAINNILKHKYWEKKNG